MSDVPGPSSPLHCEADIGPYHWPPIAETGRVVVKVRTSIDVEIQKPNGKDPARSKLKGKKPAAVNFEFQWTRACEKEGNAIRLALDPNGENSGKVWEVTNPECNGRGVRHVLFKEAGELVITGDAYSFTLAGDGWTEPTKAAVGGTSTPVKSVPANAKIIMGQDLPNLPGIPLGEIQPTGFDDPKKKPNAGAD